MPNFKALNFLRLTEKILNIHRDYLFMPRKKQLVVNGLILLDFVISICISIDSVQLVLQVYYANPVGLYSTLFFQLYFVAHGNLLMLYFAPRLGKEFQKNIFNLSLTNGVVKGHPLYEKILSKLSYKCLVIVLSVLIFRIGMNVSLVVYTRFYFKPRVYVDTFSHTLFFVLRTWSEARFVIGVLMYYCLITIISGTLQALNALIKDSASITLEDHLSSYVAVYRQLLISVRYLEKCFGHHILIAISLATSDIVWTAFKNLQRVIAMGNMLSTIQPSAWFTLMLHVSVFVSMALKGQEVPNNVLAINRSLAKIITETSKDHEAPLFRSLKDFHRLVRVQPLSIRLLPSVPAGMYLLPAVLSLSVQYIIVSLQLHDDI